MHKSHAKTNAVKTIVAKTNTVKTNAAKTKATRRTAKQIQYLKAEISKRDMQGRSQARIAEELHITQQMVSHYLRPIHAELRQCIVPDQVIVRRQQIAKVRRVMSDLWDDIAEDQQELHEHPENRTRIKASIATTRRAILHCIADESKLLGLYEKLDVMAAFRDLLAQLSPQELADILESIPKETTP